MNLYVDLQTDTRVILAVDHAGKHWEIDVTIDDEDGGILAEIGRDSILGASAEFGWDENHVNEPQD
jgi:CYTH domain-containing protein